MQTKEKGMVESRPLDLEAFVQGMGKRRRKRKIEKPTPTEAAIVETSPLQSEAVPPPTPPTASETALTHPTVLSVLAKVLDRLLSWESTQLIVSLIGFGVGTLMVTYEHFRAAECSFAIAGVSAFLWLYRAKLATFEEGFEKRIVRILGTLCIVTLFGWLIGSTVARGKEVKTTNERLRDTERARVAIESVHFLAEARIPLRPGMTLPDGSTNHFDLVVVPGSPIRIQVHVRNASDEADATDIVWYAKIIVSPELSAEAEDAEFVKLRQSVLGREASLNVGSRDTLNVTSDPVSATDAMDVVLNHKKLVYVLVASSSRDKFGDNGSSFCGEYQSPGWGENVGCHGHDWEFLRPVPR
jgi:hypothetical protein